MPRHSGTCPRSTFGVTLVTFDSILKSCKVLSNGLVQKEGDGIISRYFFGSVGSWKNLIRKK